MNLDIFDFAPMDYEKWPRVLWNRGDIWQTDQNGIPRRMHCDCYGNLPSVYVPEPLPMKYKNRKLTHIIISCNSCELVTGIELHFGNPAADGYCLSVAPETMEATDRTDFYRPCRK